MSVLRRIVRLLCASLLATTSAAHALPSRLYWTDPTSDEICFARPDGVGFVTCVSLGNDATPWGIAFDPVAAEIVWSEQLSDSIRRGDLQLTAATTVISDPGALEEPFHIDIDIPGRTVYFARDGLGANEAIGRVRLDGTQLELVVELAADVAFDGIAVDSATGLFYTTTFRGNDIRRYTLDGGSATVLIGGQTRPNGIALDPVGGKIYWAQGDGTTPGSDSIRRANLDGSAAEVIVAGLTDPRDVAVDPVSGTLYWADNGTKQIRRANLDGSNAEVVIDAAGAELAGLALAFDSDDDDTFDDLDDCPLDSEKTSPGQCGCGVSDADSDLDGVVDCLDLCPFDPEKSAPLSCGCGVADIDSDSDGVLDCNDLTAPDAPLITTPRSGQDVSTRPEVSGSVEPRATVVLLDDGIEVGTAMADASGAFTVVPTSALALGPHTLSIEAIDAAGNRGPRSEAVTVLAEERLDPTVYAFWNGNLEMLNVLSLRATGTRPASVEIQLLDHTGRPGGAAALLLDENNQLDVLINQLDGFSGAGYGLVRIVSSGSAIDGASFEYRFAAAGTVRPEEAVSSDVLAYTKALPLRNSLQGVSYALFNTFDPSRAGMPSDAAPVENWLQLGATGAAAATFTVELFSQDGVLLRTDRVTVPAGGRSDVEVGHLNPGRDRAGLVRITPASSTEPYLAAVSRYGGVTAPPSEAFASAASVQQPSAASDYCALSSGANSETWVVIANPNAETARAEVALFSEGPATAVETTLTLAPFSQLHVFGNQVLLAGRSGVARIRSLDSMPLLAQCETYFYDAEQRAVTAAMLSPVRPLAGALEHASYNAFLGQLNWLKLTALRGSASPRTLEVFQNGDPLGTFAVGLAPFASLDVGLHLLDPAIQNDTYGTFTLEDSLPGGGLFADLLQLQLDANSSVTAAESLPVR